MPGTQVLDEDLLNSALVNAGSVSHFVSCVEVHPHTCTYAGWDHHSLLHRGYSQFASCLRRDPNKGTEHGRPYSPCSRALKVALLRMDRTDIAACNPRFVRPISIRLEMGCPRSYYSAWAVFQSFLCVSDISRNPSIAPTRGI